MLGLDETKPEAQILARFAESFVKGAALNDHQLADQFVVVSGPVGVGKTHVCREVAKALNSWAVDLWSDGFWPGGRVPYAEFAIWSKRVELERPAFEDWMAQACEASWLVLDDVGAETDRYKSGEPVERLRRVLDLARTRWMLVSTNVPVSRWPATFDLRVADRLSAARCIDLAGLKSYRPNGKV